MRLSRSASRQRGLVVDEAARGGDEIGVRLHQREFARADHAAAFPGQRATDRDVIRAAQQFVEFDLLAAPRRHFLGREIGIVGQHLHAEQALAELGDAAADIAEPDDADGLALRLGADQRIAVDVRARAAARGRPRGFVSTASAACRARVRPPNGVAAGLIDDQHARRGAGIDIDGIEARAVAGDDQEVRRAPQQVLIDMEMLCEFIARRADLIGVRRRQDRRRRRRPDFRSPAGRAARRAAPCRMSA